MFIRVCLLTGMLNLYDILRDGWIYYPRTNRLDFERSRSSILRDQGHRGQKVKVVLCDTFKTVVESPQKLESSLLNFVDIKI